MSDKKNSLEMYLVEKFKEHYKLNEIENLLEKIDKNAFFIKDESDNRDYFFYANELKLRKNK